MIIGFDFRTRREDGRLWFSVHPLGMKSVHIAAAIVFALFAWVACEITDVPDTKPTTNLNSLVMP